MHLFASLRHAGLADFGNSGRGYAVDCLFLVAEFGGSQSYSLPLLSLKCFHSRRD